MTAVSRVRVSVCANQSAADVAACVAGGVDAVGVLVQVRHRAEDAVDLATAARLLAGVPPYVGRYAVTHATELDELLALAELPVDTVQLHAEVPPATAARFRERAPGLRLLKALAVAGTPLARSDRENGGSPRSRRAAGWLETAAVAAWARLVDGLVLDSVNPAEDRIGGTGRTHDWTVSARIARASPVPVILAGGLRPSNVAAAVRAVRPWAVNVNSGVERGGAKDAALVAAFVRGASVPA